MGITRCQDKLYCLSCVLLLFNKSPKWTLYNWNCSHIYPSSTVLLPLLYSMCVYMSLLWNSEAQEARWLGPPRPLWSVLNPHQSLFSWGRGWVMLPWTAQLKHKQQDNMCIRLNYMLVKWMFNLAFWCNNLKNEAKSERSGGFIYVAIGKMQFELLWH